MNIKKEITTVEHLELSDQDIISLLKKQKIIDDIKEINDINIYFRVPGGGDWSSENVDIDQDYPIRITITYKEKKC